MQHPACGTSAVDISFRAKIDPQSFPVHQREHLSANDAVHAPVKFGGTELRACSPHQCQEQLDRSFEYLADVRQHRGRGIHQRTPIQSLETPAGLTLLSTGSALRRRIAAEEKSRLKERPEHLHDIRARAIGVPFFNLPQLPQMLLLEWPEAGFEQVAEKFALAAPVMLQRTKVGSGPLGDGADGRALI